MYKKAEYQVVCDCCGKAFIAHRKDNRFCSRKCRDVSYKQRKGQDSRLEPRSVVCKICGKPFKTFNATKATCSEECSRGLKRKGTWIEKSCAICGELFETHWDSQMTCGSGCCKEEYKKKQHKVRNERAKNNSRNQLKKLEKQWQNALHTVERECKYCGSLFYCLDTNNKQCCSSECSKKYGYQRANKRIPKEQRVDKIPLKRLYKRDKGICYLCGEPCDWDDWRISAKGNSYPGDKYPTIEHIIPISKGGLDAWDNVRLACWKCNLDKADGIIKMQPMSKEFAYSQKYSATPAKKTAQYTLDGKLIKIWESTGQIRRELGLNDKHIQSVCRGYKSNTGNAYGFHWEYVS